MKQTIDGLQVDNKTVFVRVDFNVPMKDGVITDDTRIRSALPTINYLIEKGAKVILASHFGRPKGERKPEMSLAPCAKHLSELINKPVAFVDDCIGSKVEVAVKALQPGDVLMLENLRYHNEETKNDPEFAKQLASLADVAINDAFGVSHRNAASVVGIADYIPMAAGFLLKKEIDALAFPPGKVVGGASELIEEVAGSKISGEEDRYSHTDLSDFQANVEGSKKIVDLFRPLIEAKDKALLEKTDANFKQVEDILAKYKKQDGFELYDKLSEEDRKALQAPINALAEDLAKLRGILGLK